MISTQSKTIWLLATSLFLAGCQTANQLPVQTLNKVDLPRFMGDWYVISSIPTMIEKDIYNAVESYELVGDKKIKTTFSFRKGSTEGELKTYHPTGYVVENSGNAIWGMQFVWPIKAEYRIMYLDDEYKYTVIGRNKRDYAWIMSRQPNIDEDLYRRLTQLLEENGYDTSRLVKVPQEWSKS